ncbi:MAG: class I SAM-dependent methyltransferase, partial [Candidatus Binatia bacterium]
MAVSDERPYIGGELGLFSLATNWKRYVKAEVGTYLIGDVLEVGAGIGGTTAALHDGSARRWVCLEPDTSNAKQLGALVVQRWERNNTHVIAGSLRALAERPSFDCILYMDVLEHIQDDRVQIEAAARLVRNGGYIVVLSPAHQWLFSKFDKSIGHLRRYNKRNLRSLIPSGWVEKKMVYLDSIGFFLSLANLLALRQAMPSHWQIYLWDWLCVPLSRIMDRLL